LYKTVLYSTFLLYLHDFIYIIFYMFIIIKALDALNEYLK
jgi:large-conductance mechanosensitive channel